MYPSVTNKQDGKNTPTNSKSFIIRLHIPRKILNLCKHIKDVDNEQLLSGVDTTFMECIMQKKII